MMANEVRLIDANALVARWEAAMLYMVKEADGRHTISMEMLLKDVKKAPTLDPESLRPKGRWVDQEWNVMWQSMTATCSHCLERGEVRVRTDYEGKKVIDSSCCPNCGADMRG